MTILSLLSSAFFGAWVFTMTPDRHGGDIAVLAAVAAAIVGYCVPWLVMLWAKRAPVVAAVLIVGAVLGAAHTCFVSEGRPLFHWDIPQHREGPALIAKAETRRRVNE